MRSRQPSLIILLILILTTACSPVGIATTQGSKANGTATGSPPQSDPSAPDNSFSITDALGRELVFESPPERLAIAGRANSLLVNSLYMFPEASQRLVGIEHRTQSNISILPIIEPNINDKILFEKNAGAEQIAPSKPEVVILKSYMADSLGHPLEQLGIAVVYLDLETPEQFFRDVNALGELLGNPTRALEVQDFYEQRLDRIRQRTESIPETLKPKVLVLQYSEVGGDIAFEIPAATWLQTTMVELAGGLPVWTEASETGGWALINFEQIAAWNPDQIYIIYYPGDASPIRQRLESDPKWQSLHAVQNDQIFAFPGDYLSWDQPDPRWILGLSWLATKLQPGLFGDIDIMQEVLQFYDQLYRLDQETIQDEVVPTLNGDLP